MSEHDEQLFQLLEKFATASEEGEYGIAAVQFEEHDPLVVLRDIRILSRSGLLEEKSAIAGDGTHDLYEITDNGYRLYRSNNSKGKRSLDWQEISANFGNFKYSDVNIDNSGSMSANFGQGGSHQTVGFTKENISLDYSVLQSIISRALSATEEIEDEDDKSDAKIEVEKLDKAAKEGKVDRFIKISSELVSLTGKLAETAPKFAGAVALIWKMVDQTNS